MRMLRGLLLPVALALAWIGAAFAQAPPGWAPQGGNVPLPVSNVSSSVALPSMIAPPTPNAVVCNIGANAAYVLFGSSSVAVTTTSGSLVAAGVCKAFSPPVGTAYVAAITSSSTTTLEIETGTGSPLSAVPGGAGGVGAPMQSNAANATSAALANIIASASSAAQAPTGQWTFIAPILGTPASGVATNLTGTAAGLTAGGAPWSGITGTPTTLSGYGITSPLPVAQGGTAAASAGGTALDNISGFASTGFLTRTGAGTYAFQSTTNGLTLANLAQIGANTVLGNSGSGTANVAAMSVGGCSTASSALIWTTNTGFGCNTSITATTNANLTGPVTSTGNATAIATAAITQTMVAAATLATGTSVSLTAPRQYYVCTGTCTVTPPVPAAGSEFCILNDDNVATVITLAALGSSARYEATARTGYGTAGTGTFVSGGAVGDKVCLLGRDSTHYLTASFTGTWVAN